MYSTQIDLVGKNIQLPSTMHQLYSRQ